LAVVETSIECYRSSYDGLAADVFAGVEEGFYKGVKEGIKRGFVEGIQECLMVGIDNIDAKKADDIIKDALQDASTGAFSTAIQSTAREEYRAVVGPYFKHFMRDACDKAVNDIHDDPARIERSSATFLKCCVGESMERIKACVGSTCDMFRKKTPTDKLFGSFLDGLQDVFNKDLDDGLKACEERIDKEIDGKVVDS